ncbi:hypothetical protein [Amycolatopsis sp. MtRt-6]|uniref:hypothetical protein n=1 Tax=Amycolatopsis sp. MtRt-6 TaxID=2792782 RepID=UPI001A9003BC|nr:hypothetical protein [Amycolatopsis sp. MtRt-6]
MSTQCERQAEAWPHPFETNCPATEAQRRPPEYPARVFGWPAAVALMVLVLATFGFSFALLRTGSDPRSAVTIPLFLLFGAGTLVVPVAGTRVRTRVGAAVKGAVDGARGKR